MSGGSWVWVERAGSCSWLSTIAVLQASQAVLDMNGSELDGRFIMVREDREDRDAQRGRPKGPSGAPMESSGLQVPPSSFCARLHFIGRIIGI